MTDRRTYFFLGAGLIVLVIQPIIPQYRWATISVAIIYLAFAILFATASISAKRAAKKNGHL
ncbi:MAG: hypothetical protein ACRDZM_05545 [Acidimicrobiia bacterium]